MRQTKRNSARAKKKSINKFIKPTSERMSKSDYETINKERVKLNAINLLHEKGDIDSNAVSAAQWWLNDYLFAYYGYADFLNDSLSTKQQKGDQITFNLGKAKAGLRISKVQKTLGLCVHERLRLLLIEELSFTGLGKIFYPGKDDTTARKSAQAQMALILTQLSEFYLEEHKQKNLETFLQIRAVLFIKNDKLGIFIFKVAIIKLATFFINQFKKNYQLI